MPRRIFLAVSGEKTIALLSHRFAEFADAVFFDLRAIYRHDENIVRNLVIRLLKISPQNHYRLYPHLARYILNVVKNHKRIWPYIGDPPMFRAVLVSPCRYHKNLKFYLLTAEKLVFTHIVQFINNGPRILAKTPFTLLWKTL